MLPSSHGKCPGISSIPRHRDTGISAGLEVCSVGCSQKMKQHRKSSNAKSLAYCRAIGTRLQAAEPAPLSAEHTLTPAPGQTHPPQGHTWL